jgi:hypothetical protein
MNPRPRVARRNPAYPRLAWIGAAVASAACQPAAPRAHGPSAPAGGDPSGISGPDPNVLVIAAPPPAPIAAPPPGSPPPSTIDLGDDQGERIGGEAACLGDCPAAFNEAVRVFADLSLRVESGQVLDARDAAMALRPALRRCARSVAHQARGGAGTVRLRLVVEADGRVSEVVRLSTEGPVAAAAGCVEAAARSARFAGRAGRATTVLLSVALRVEGG